MIKTFGGVVNYLPNFSLIFIIFVLGALGLPGTTGFIGEFLVLLGAFKINYLVAILASTGVVLCAAYMLWMAKRVVFGKTNNPLVSKLKDINYLEGTVLILLCLISLIFGFYPEPLLNTMDLSVNEIIENHQNEITVNLIGKK